MVCCCRQNSSTYNTQFGIEIKIKSLQNRYAYGSFRYETDYHSGMPGNIFMKGILKLTHQQTGYLTCCIGIQQDCRYMLYDAYV